MEHLIFAGFVLVSALLFALVEIQIEGPHGWAERLPTWRIENRWTRLIYSKRALTGYHLYVQLLMVVLSHLPLAFFPDRWGWSAELKSMCFLIYFFIVEDFLWFVLNPAYGIRKFRKQHIHWHAPTWWIVMPRDYWIFGALGAAAYALACRWN